MLYVSSAGGLHENAKYSVFLGMKLFQARAVDIPCCCLLLLPPAAPADAPAADSAAAAGHANVEGMKSHLPGTEEHRMREAGVIGGGSAMTGTHGTGTQGKQHTQTRVPQSRLQSASNGQLWAGGLATSFKNCLLCRIVGLTVCSVQ